MRKNKNKGFTIVELIVVMAIIAILILIAVPTFNKYIDRANKTAQMGTANTIYKSAISAVSEYKTHPMDPWNPWANWDELVANISEGVDGDTNVTTTRYYKLGFAAMSFFSIPADQWGVIIYFEPQNIRLSSDGPIMLIAPVKSGRRNVYENGKFVYSVKEDFTDIPWPDPVK